MVTNEFLTMKYFDVDTRSVLFLWSFGATRC
jgi:hypothetical protein